MDQIDPVAKLLLQLIFLSGALYGAFLLAGFAYMAHQDWKDGKEKRAAKKRWPEIKAARDANRIKYNLHVPKRGSGL